MSCCSSSTFGLSSLAVLVGLAAVQRINMMLLHMNEWVYRALGRCSTRLAYFYRRIWLLFLSSQVPRCPHCRALVPEYMSLLLKNRSFHG